MHRQEKIDDLNSSVITSIVHNSRSGSEDKTRSICAHIIKSLLQNNGNDHTHTQSTETHKLDVIRLIHLNEHSSILGIHNYKSHLRLNSVYCRKSQSIIISRLSRLKPVLLSHMLMYIYTSIIQPKIDYAISIWGYTTAHNINKVQRLQNRAARILTGNYDYVNTCKRY